MTTTDAFIKKADTNAEQARAVAEELGHVFHADLEGFVLTPQELADIIKRNATYTDEALSKVTVTVAWEDGEKTAIEVFGNEKHARRMVALQESNATNNNLLVWINKQNSLRIERWYESGGTSQVRVFSSLDDMDLDQPTGKAVTVIEALSMAKRHQEGLS